MTFVACLYYGQGYIGPKRGLLVVNPKTPAALRSSIVSMPRSITVQENIRTHVPSSNS
jgi:hypothetical protein